jgi:hypothetical protein
MISIPPLPKKTESDLRIFQIRASKVGMRLKITGWNEQPGAMLLTLENLDTGEIFQHRPGSLLTMRIGKACNERKVKTPVGLVLEVERGIHPNFHRLTVQR